MAISITITDQIAPSIKRKLEEIGKGLDHVETTGEKAAKGLNDANNSVTKLTKTVTLFAKSLAGLAGAKQLVEMSSAFDSLNNKIRAAVGDNRQTIDAFRADIQRMAAESGTAIAGMTAAFQRFNAPLAKLGKDASDTLKFVDTLSKGMTNVGATSQEVEGTMVQLSQAFNMGMLRGQELLSIATNFPALLDQIAEDLGVTRGELQDLSSQGKITGDVIYNAVSKMSNSINRDFAKANLTLEQGFIVLKDAVSLFVGELLEALGFTGTFGDALAAVAEVITNLSEKMDYIVPVIRLLGAAFLGVKIQAAASAISVAAAGVASAAAAKGVSILTVAQRGLNAAMSANPVGAVITGLWALYEVYQYLNDKVDEYLNKEGLAMQKRVEHIDRVAEAEKKAHAERVEGYNELKRAKERAGELGVPSNVGLHMAAKDENLALAAILKRANIAAEEYDAKKKIVKLSEREAAAERAVQEYRAKALADIERFTLDIAARDRNRQEIEELSEYIRKRELEAYDSAEAERARNRTAEEYNRLLAARRVAILEISKALEEERDKLYLSERQIRDYDLRKQLKDAITQGGKLGVTEELESFFNAMVGLNNQLENARQEQRLFSRLVEIELDKQVKIEKEKAALRKQNLDDLKKQDELERKIAENMQDFLALNVLITKEQRAQADVSKFVAEQQKLGQTFTSYETNALLTARTNAMQLAEDAQIAASLQIEIERDKYAAIENLRKQGYLSEVQYSRAASTLRKQEAEQTLSQFANIFGQIAGLSASGSEEMFAISKAGAIAQATVNTILASSKALAEGGFFLGPVFAATIGAIGAAQVAEIASRSYSAPTVTRSAGFKQGGYTGNIPPGEVAGAVHGREFVFDAAATARIGVQNLEALRSGNNSQTNGGNGEVNVAVVNNEKAALAALSSAAGRKIIVDAVASNASALRRYL